MTKAKSKKDKSETKTSKIEDQDLEQVGGGSLFASRASKAKKAEEKRMLAERRHDIETHPEKWTTIEGIGPKIKHEDALKKFDEIIKKRGI